MNKKILTAAIGAAMIAGPLAAQADLKISGRVAGSLTSNNGVIMFDDRGSTRLQFDWKDDSGWYARSAVDNRNLSGGGSGVGRDQYVGLKTGSGSFQFGRMAGAVKNLEGDPFITNFLELRNNSFVKGGGYGSNSFVNTMVQYANKFGDTSVKFQYDPTTAKSGDMGLGVKAKMAGANVFFGWNNEGNVAGEGYWKVGGTMKFGDIKGRFIYQSDTTASVAVASWVLGAEMGLGDGQIFDVTYTDKGTDGVNAGYRIAYMNRVTKKSRWFVGYTQNGSGASNAARYGAGARIDI